MGSKLKGVILDMDGTLIDSNDAHAEAFVIAIEDCGEKASYDRIRSLIGKGGDILLSEALNVDPDSELVERISKLKKEIFSRDYLPKLKPFPHVRTLLENLKEQNLKLVLASSASKSELKKLVEVCGIEDLLDGATNADDVEESKPAPDAVEEALKTAGLKPEEAVMIGDTPYDVEAAKKAGVKVIAFKSGGWSATHLSKADQIYENAEDLKNNLPHSLLAP